MQPYAAKQINLIKILVASVLPATEQENHENALPAHSYYYRDILISLHQHMQVCLMIYQFHTQPWFSSHD